MVGPAPFFYLGACSARAGRPPAALPGARAEGRRVPAKVERYDWRPTVPFESFKIFEKIGKIIPIFFESSEFGAVQRIANLADLAKRCKMSIWLQKSALIQPRTSSLKFD